MQKIFGYAYILPYFLPELFFAEKCILNLLILSFILASYTLYFLFISFRFQSTNFSIFSAKKRASRNTSFFFFLAFRIYAICMCVCVHSTRRFRLPFPWSSSPMLFQKSTLVKWVFTGRRRANVRSYSSALINL